MERRFTVDAEVVSATGGSDGAYDLLDDDQSGQTADEIVRKLAIVLAQSVRSMLFDGTDCGHELVIRIRDKGDA